VNIAQVIFEVVIIGAIMLQQVHSTYMQRFMNIIFVALGFETCLIGSYAYILHGMDHFRVASIIWELYKLVRLFISLPFCYPTVVFTNKKIKLHILFLFLSSIIIVGGIVDCTTNKRAGIFSDYVNTTFMLIFAFTLHHYYQLESDIQGLNSLIVIETTLYYAQWFADFSFF
jgi:hypothetical protein